MKAYLCSIGEKTTEICKEQLEKFGFNVVLIDGKESWYEKYKKFINLASKEKEDCIRIDADIIPNENIKEFKNIGNATFYSDEHYMFKPLMSQAKSYDFYKNYIGVTSPVYYNKKAIKIIKDNWNLIGKKRPETDASRIKEINKYLFTKDLIIGIHGFFQTRDDLIRHKLNKIERKQFGNYNFYLAEKLLNLWEKN